MRGGADLLDALKACYVIVAAMDCAVGEAGDQTHSYGDFIQELENVRIQGLCSLKVELGGALRGCGMELAM